MSDPLRLPGYDAWKLASPPDPVAECVGCLRWFHPDRLDDNNHCKICQDDGPRYLPENEEEPLSNVPQDDKV